MTGVEFLQSAKVVSASKGFLLDDIIAMSTVTAGAKSTGDIANALCAPAGSASQRLTRLHRDGYLENERTGRSSLWALSPEGEDVLNDVLIGITKHYQKKQN